MLFATDPNSRIWFWLSVHLVAATYRSPF